MATPLEERVPRLREPIRALGPTLVLLAHGLQTVAFGGAKHGGSSSLTFAELVRSD